MGDRLQSEGNLGTDRLFTGQRYDDTGLYYYGARYYDPEIGRFISPDAIVPDPMNPQAFNRYSYCLNNPLKYTDPSGNIVEVNDYIIETTITENGWTITYERRDDTMQKAWDLFKSVAPDIAHILEDSEKVIHIQSKDYTDDTGGAVKGLNIFIDLDTIANGIKDTTSVIAHEVVHVTTNIFDIKSKNSIYEESVAYQYQWTINAKIGYDKRPW